jgi:hypothetical protein
MEVIKPGTHLAAGSGYPASTQPTIERPATTTVHPPPTKTVPATAPAGVRATPTGRVAAPTASPAAEPAAAQAPTPPAAPFAVPAAVQAAPTPVPTGVRGIVDFNGIMLNAVTILDSCEHDKNGQTWRKDDETTFLLREYHNCYMASGVKKNKILIVLQRFWGEFGYRTAGFNYDLSTLAAGYRSGLWPDTQQDHFLFWIKVCSRQTCSRYELTVVTEDLQVFDKSREREQGRRSQHVFDGPQRGRSVQPSP